MVLQSIWFFLWGLLWALYFMTDGFDLGIGALYPVLGKTDEDKNTMINAMGPLWDGNEVWLLTAGGVTFAAFPLVYSVMFSSLYTALMLILFALNSATKSIIQYGKRSGIYASSSAVSLRPFFSGWPLPIYFREFPSTARDFIRGTC